MPDCINKLVRRARQCPVACSLKILFLLLFMVELTAATFYQSSVSYQLFAALLAATGYVAVLALATDNNCNLKLSDDD
jgi:hypothetical protein